MTNLLNSLNTTARTENGALTNHSSLSACLDLFFQVGSARGHDLTLQYMHALGEDRERTLRIMQWARDVRQGAGEREQFRRFLKFLISKGLEEDVEALLPKIPTLGRWDDVLVLLNTPCEEAALKMIANALTTGDSLCAKWMPRPKGKHLETARKIASFMKLSERNYRKVVVGLSNTVEQLICDNNWKVVDFSKVPSLASARYQKAFNKHAPEEYGEYRNNLVSGDTKINAAAVYPYDVVKSAFKGDPTVANEQWKVLPNYITGNVKNILPIVDISGSMYDPAGGMKNVDCIDVAIGLGIYIAERTEGAFKDHFITFAEVPKLVRLTPGMTLMDKVNYTKSTKAGYSTDFNAVFNQILAVAKRDKLKQEDLPEIVIALSDMQFDMAERGLNLSKEKTNFKLIDKAFKKAGYTRPKLVFWNMRVRPNNFPVTINDDNTALISGFSPAIMKSILSAKDFSPESIMLSTINIPRYDI